MEPQPCLFMIAASQGRKPVVGTRVSEHFACFAMPEYGSAPRFSLTHIPTGIAVGLVADELDAATIATFIEPLMDWTPADVNKLPYAELQQVRQAMRPFYDNGTIVAGGHKL